MDIVYSHAMSWWHEFVNELKFKPLREQTRVKSESYNIFYCSPFY